MVCVFLFGGGRGGKRNPLEKGWLSEQTVSRQRGVRTVTQDPAVGTRVAAETRLRSAGRSRRVLEELPEDSCVCCA